LLKRLDYDVRKQYIFSLDANLALPIQQRAVATVVVNVLEEDDHQPSFPKQSYRVNVSEATLVGTPIIEVTANDLDTQPLLRYSIVSGDNGKFQIDEVTGVITTKGDLDYDLQKLYQMTVLARDSSRSTSAAVEVTVYPVNKPGPQFEQAIYIETIPETYPTTSPNNLVLKVSHINGIAPFTYTINEPSGREFFTLDQNGNIRAIKGFNYELQRQHVFTMTVQGRRQSGQATVIVNIENINDVCPVFVASPVVRYNGNPELNTLVHVVRAVDGDVLPFNFTITSGNDDGYFQIDRVTGEIRTVKQFPRSFTKTFTLLVTANDGQCPQTPTDVVQIIVETCPDPQDFHFKRPKYVFVLKEDRALGGFGSVDLTSNRPASLQILTSGITHFNLNNQGTVFFFV